MDNERQEVQRGRKRGRPARASTKGTAPAASKNKRRKTKAQQKQEAEEERQAAALATLNQKKEQTKEVVASLSADEVREILVEALEKDPNLLFEILERRNRHLEEAPGPQPSSSNCPSWCICTFCRNMPSEAEKLCCGKQPQLCLSRLASFQLLMLDEEVLDVARLYRQDMLAFPPDQDRNRGRRHAAYRQFTLWEHGRLGAGNRLVIPSCCVWRIRNKFPDAFGQYTGFLPGRLG